MSSSIGSNVAALRRQALRLQLESATGLITLFEAQEERQLIHTGLRCILSKLNASAEVKPLEEALNQAEYSKDRCTVVFRYAAAVDEDIRLISRLKAMVGDARMSDEQSPASNGMLRVDVGSSTPHPETHSPMPRIEQQRQFDNGVASAAQWPSADVTASSRTRSSADVMASSATERLLLLGSIMQRYDSRHLATEQLSTTRSSSRPASGSFILGKQLSEHAQLRHDRLKEALTLSHEAATPLPRALTTLPTQRAALASPSASSSQRAALASPSALSSQRAALASPSASSSQTAALASPSASSSQRAALASPSASSSAIRKADKTLSKKAQSKPTRTASRGRSAQSKQAQKGLRSRQPSAEAIRQARKAAGRRAAGRIHAERKRLSEEAAKEKHRMQTVKTIGLEIHREALARAGRATQRANPPVRKQRNQRKQSQPQQGAASNATGAGRQQLQPSNNATSRAAIHSTADQGSTAKSLATTRQLASQRASAATKALKRLAEAEDKARIEKRMAAFRKRDERLEELRRSRTRLAKSPTIIHGLRSSRTPRTKPRRKVFPRAVISPSASASQMLPIAAAAAPEEVHEVDSPPKTGNAGSAPSKELSCFAPQDTVSEHSSGSGHPESNQRGNCETQQGAEINEPLVHAGGAIFVGADGAMGTTISAEHEAKTSSGQKSSDKETIASVLNESDSDDDNTAAVTMVRPMPSLGELGFGWQNRRTPLPSSQVSPSRMTAVEPMTLELLLEQQALELAASPD